MPKSFQLHYGLGECWKLEPPAGVEVISCGAPRQLALDDVTRATQAALQAPLDYPPLWQVAVPGDHVVLCLAEYVPQAEAVVGAVVEGLLAAGIKPADITLLLAADAPQSPPELLDRVAPEVAQYIKNVAHTPDDRDHLSYLAATTEGKPIYINRLLSDADLVIPIGCLRVEGALAYHGIYGDVFPAFSDTKNVQRYRWPRVKESAVQAKRFDRETREASWLLGVHFLVQVVPGPDGQVLAVLAGRTEAVDTAGQAACAAAWAEAVPHRAELVVAALSGEPAEQTWDNVARALASAARIVEPGGAVALCTNLEEPLGPALAALARTEQSDELMHAIAKERPRDTLVAVQLTEALARGPVYLISRLESAVVEELGITPLEEMSEIDRLVGRHTSSILLANAQYALAHPADEVTALPPMPVKKPRKKAR